MKSIVLLFALLPTLAIAAQTKLHDRNPGVRTGFPAIDCFNRTGALSNRNAAILCSGATDANAPIDCFNRTGALSDLDAAILCSKAGAGAAVADQAP